MTATRERASSLLSRIKERFSLEELRERQAPKPDRPLPPTIRTTKSVTEKVLDHHWATLLKHAPVDANDQAILADPLTRASLPQFDRNIENCIGTVKIPVGVIGPLRVNGIFAQGDYYVPLATTEATLVASYGRGAQAISAGGGCTTALFNDGLSRSPAFAFRTINAAGEFADWIASRFEELKQVAESTTRHGRLTDLRIHMEGNHVYLNCDYLTGDASGQNMTTLATAALCRFVVDHTPIPPEYWFLESNFSGDKKASAMSFVTVRGKKVAAEILLPRKIVGSILHADTESMQNYWRLSALGGVMSGTIGVQGHFANGLAALYLATGQDVACVSEASVGITRLEDRDGDLYAAVTLPNITVGTVGGGTGLPSQAAGLRLLGLAGSGHVHALAEICAALCLAGELSLIAALASGNFAAAHHALARGRGHDRPS